MQLRMSEISNKMESESKTNEGKVFRVRYVGPHWAWDCNMYSKDIRRIHLLVYGWMYVHAAEVLLCRDSGRERGR